MTREERATLHRWCVMYRRTREIRALAVRACECVDIIAEDDFARAELLIARIARLALDRDP